MTQNSRICRVDKPEPPCSKLASLAKMTGVMGLTFCFSVASIAPAYAQQGDPTPSSVSPSTGTVPQASWWAAFPRPRATTAFRAILAGVFTTTVSSMVRSFGVQASPYVRYAVPDQSRLVGDPLNISLPADIFGGLDDGLSVSVRLADGSPLPTWMAAAFKDPLVIGSTNANPASTGVSVQNDRGYVIEENSLRILNLTDLMNPTPLGQYTYSGNTSIQGVVVQDQTAYILQENSFKAVDISDPDQPVVLDSLTGTGYDSLEVHGNRAVILGSSGLEIIDLSNPSSLVRLGSYSDGLYNLMALETGRAFVTSSSGFDVLNTVNASNISPIGTYALSSILQIAVAGDRLFATNFEPPRNFWLNVLNVQNASNITGLGRYSVQNLTSIEDITVADPGGTTYLAGADGLEVVNISDPANSGLMGFFAAGNSLTGVAIAGNAAVIVSNDGTLQTLDIGRRLSGTSQAGQYVIRLDLEDNFGTVYATTNFTIRITTLPPTAVPTTAIPTSSPSGLPSASPSRPPSVSPTGVPTGVPTGSPSHDPTVSPTGVPTLSPNPGPTASPTRQPTSSPTPHPTASPTRQPTSSPTPRPTASPVPAIKPTLFITNKPTLVLSGSPTSSALTTLNPTLTSGLATPSPESPSTDSPDYLPIVGIAAGTLVAVMSIAGTLYYYIKKKKRANEDSQRQIALQEYPNFQAPSEIALSGKQRLNILLPMADREGSPMPEPGRMRLHTSHLRMSESDDLLPGDLKDIRNIMDTAVDLNDEFEIKTVGNNNVFSEGDDPYKLSGFLNEDEFEIETVGKIKHSEGNVLYNLPGNINDEDVEDMEDNEIGITISPVYDMDEEQIFNDETIKAQDDYDAVIKDKDDEKTIME